MTAQFSRRSGKYVFLSLPGLFSLVLVGGWLMAIAPESQQASRHEVQWRQQRTEAKNRQDFLAKNQIYSDYDQLIFQDLSKDQGDIGDRLQVWSDSDVSKSYADGQIVRLLDKTHQCIGYAVSGRGIYSEANSAGICQLSIADVASQLN